ncbi:MAG: ATP-binding protein [Deltaproteobacteria bacterium]|nr:ATP-binding protein [Deltaproteobacteria bacterium]
MNQPDEIFLADVVVHIDETLDPAYLARMETHLMALEGVHSVLMHENKPHLMKVGFHPEKVHTMDILQQVIRQGVHAELIGL